MKPIRAYTMSETFSAFLSRVCQKVDQALASENLTSHEVEMAYSMWQNHKSAGDVFVEIYNRRLLNWHGLPVLPQQ